MANLMVMTVKTQHDRQQPGTEQVRPDWTGANITVSRNWQRPSRLSSAATCPPKHECVTLGWPLIVGPARETQQWDSCRETPLNIRSRDHKYQVSSSHKWQFLFSLLNLTLPVSHLFSFWNTWILFTIDPHFTANKNSLNRECYCLSSH